MEEQGKAIRPESIEWTFKIGYHPDLKFWYSCIFLDTPAESRMCTVDKDVIITHLIDKLSAIFSVDSNCEDEREFWNTIREIEPDLRRFRKSAIIRKGSKT